MGIEEKLTLFQELIRCCNELFVWSFDSVWNLLSTNCPNSALLDTFLRISLPQELGDTRRPLVINNPLGLQWISDFQMSEEKLEKIHLIGPVFTEQFSLSALEAVLNRLQLPNKVKRDFIAQVKTIPVVPVTRFYEYALMLHFCLTGQHITASDLRYPISKGTTVSASRTQNDAYASWAMEQRLLTLVEEGNLDYKKISGQVVGISDLADLGNGNHIRNYKNLTIVFTALCTRAAIRGGLTPDVAYGLSDMYIRAIEACRNAGEIYETSMSMQDDFIHRVHHCRTHLEISLQVQKCCFYIQTHLQSKITISELASQVGYSENYLSKKFKREMGTSIVEYINQQKIDHARILLQAESTPINDIAEHLGFSSQSYFAEQFRKVTGVSPREYRLRALQEN